MTVTGTGREFEMSRGISVSCDMTLTVEEGFALTASPNARASVE